MSYTIHCGDCLEILPTLEAGSVNAIITDLPYQQTACAWDSVIPFAPMWEQVKRVLKPHGIFVTTASQPFTSALVMSNPKWFRYCWVWDKVNRYTGYANANKMPLRRHDDICVFYAQLPTFNKQYRTGKPYKTFSGGNMGKHLGRTGLTNRHVENDGDHHNPCSIIEVSAKTPEQGLHPTQKPVALFAYLIRTYTNPGDTVMDFCMGSGTTGVAAIKEGRSFVGIERDPGYFAIAQRRLEDAAAQPLLLEVTP